MKRLIAAITLTGGLVGGGVAVPLIVTAQPAAAAHGQGSGGATHFTSSGYNVTIHHGGSSQASTFGAATGGNGDFGPGGGTCVVNPSGGHVNGPVNAVLCIVPF